MTSARYASSTLAHGIFTAKKKFMRGTFNSGRKSPERLLTEFITVSLESDTDVTCLSLTITCRSADGKTRKTRTTVSFYLQLLGRPIVF